MQSSIAPPYFLKKKKKSISLYFYPDLKQQTLGHKMTTYSHIAVTWNTDNNHCLLNHRGKSYDESQCNYIRNIPIADLGALTAAPGEKTGRYQPKTQHNLCLKLWNLWKRNSLNVFCIGFSLSNLYKALTGPLTFIKSLSLVLLQTILWLYVSFYSVIFPTEILLGQHSGA